jgi:pSer/pThr/pTyr-binding forkhead associated (FHA) protein
MVSAVDFFLIPAQGDGQRLEPGKRYLIGRGDDADIRLSDALASRHHAELTWDPDRLWLLNDLGSANGTHLGEGRLSAAAELADGDVLRFGGQLFTYRLVPPGAELGEAMPSDAMATVAVAFSADDSVRAEGDGSFEGNFEQFGFRDVVRFLALAKRTGTLFFDQSPMRRIGFRDGVPRQARCGSSSGRKALQDFAQRPGREFRFEPGQVMAGDDDIAGDAEAIVFELVDGGDEDLDADLERAKDLQEHLLARIPDLPGYALGLHYQGLNRVSGDFYDIGPLADGRFLVVVGDVTGHGVQAALVVAGIVKGNGI